MLNQLTINLQTRKKIWFDVNDPLEAILEIIYIKIVSYIILKLSDKLFYIKERYSFLNTLSGVFSKSDEQSSNLDDESL